MTGPNPPQQPGPFGPPPGGAQPPPYGQQPYGQQPPPTPPGGQFPPGQQPPPPGGQFQPPPPPPFGQQPVQPGDYPPAPIGAPVKKSKTKLFVILGVVLAVVIGGIAWAVISGKKSPSNAEAGDCIKVNSASSTSADVEKIDCNDRGAVFKVAKRLGNDTDECPTADYPKYYQQGGSGSDFALCLMFNAKEGDCFNDANATDKVAKVDCTGAPVKVTKVANGQADEKLCGEKETPLTYPEPPTTICLTLQT